LYTEQTCHIFFEGWKTKFIIFRDEKSYLTLKTLTLETILRIIYKNLKLYYLKKSKKINN